jgi:hypothetical protein
MIGTAAWEDLGYEAALLRMKGDKENSDLLLEAVRTCSVEPLKRNQLFAAIIKATKTEIDENSSHWDE